MKSILVANWKMNPQSFKEAKTLFEATRKAAEAAKNVSLIVAPPSIYMRDLAKLYKGRRITFALQNVSAEPEGAFTGELSLSQARDSKASYVLIAHAERRAMGETNEDARRKVGAALSSQITPILCVGESSRDQTGTHFTKVQEQLRIGLGDVAPGKISRVVIAYEPVWAIGASTPMDARSMHEMAIYIRKTAVASHGKDGMQIKILYGGSIDETNAADMLRHGDVNGLLVGRASTNQYKCRALIEALNEA